MKGCELKKESEFSFASPAMLTERLGTKSQSRGARSLKVWRAECFAICAEPRGAKKLPWKKT
jgi:hypothetical protein